MFRRIASVLTAAALLGTTACADNILKERPVSRTTRTARTQPSLSGATTEESSVCAAYRRQLHQAQSGKVLAPTAAQREQLRVRELTLNAVIADACE